MGNPSARVDKENGAVGGVENGAQETLALSHAAGVAMGLVKREGTEQHEGERYGKGNITLTPPRGEVLVARLANVDVKAEFRIKAIGVQAADAIDAGRA